ncbi:MAG: oligosaccharide flippase family protein, partial [Alphaproteobacteria bacterium]|nr:oligosaccharide flippase family protein [Alphaproteobacteria bacterium]
MSSRIDSPPPRPEAGTVRANLAAMGVAEGVARVAQLLTIALLGRVLGPVGLGIVGVAWAVFQLAAPFVQYAPELMGARLVAQGTHTDEAFIDVTAIKLAIGVLSTVAMAGGAMVAFADDPAERIQVAVQALLPVAVALNGVWAFRGLRRFSAYAVVRSLHTVALLLCLVAALTLRPATWIVPAAEAAVGLAASALAFGLLFEWRTLPGLAVTMYRRIFQLRARIGEALQFGLGSFFAGAIWSVPLLVAGAMLEPARQGYLAAALRLILAVTALYQLVLQVFHPVMAHRYAHDRSAGASLAAALVVYAIVTTVPVAAGLAAFAPWIVTLLLGPDFADMANVFAVLALTIVPVVIGSVFGYALLADGRYRLSLWISAGGAAAALLGCVLAFQVRPRADAVGVLILVT